MNSTFVILAQYQRRSGTVINASINLFDFITERTPSSLIPESWDSETYSLMLRRTSEFDGCPKNDILDFKPFFDIFSGRVVRSPLDFFGRRAAEGSAGVA